MADVEGSDTQRSVQDRFYATNFSTQSGSFGGSATSFGGRSPSREPSQNGGLSASQSSRYAPIPLPRPDLAGTERPYSQGGSQSLDSAAWPVPGRGRAEQYVHAPDMIKNLLKSEGALKKWQLMDRMEARYLPESSVESPSSSRPNTQEKGLNSSSSTPALPELSKKDWSEETKNRLTKPKQMKDIQNRGQYSLNSTHLAAQWKPTQKFLEFLDRQITGSMENNKEATQELLKDMKDKKDHEKKLAIDTGRLGVEGFKELLKRRFGTVVRGWRQGLDTSGDGKLSFTEFCMACRNIGYSGDVKGLWKKMDDDNSGVVSLAELDPEAHELIESFYTYIDKKFGNILLAWEKKLDKDKNDRLDVGEFAEALQSIGFKGDSKKLFHFFTPNNGQTFISLEDVHPGAALCRMRGDKKMMTVGKGVSVEQKEANKQMSFLQRQSMGNMNTSWMKELADEQRLAVLARKQKGQDADRGSKCLSEFKRQLITKYGSIANAWKFGLDTSGDDKLSFQEFCMACRANDYRGNLKGLWEELDDDGSGVVTLKELDPKAFEALDGFKSMLREKFDNMLVAWKNGLDSDGDERLTHSEFCKRVKEMGFKGDPKYLWKLIVPLGHHYMQMEDLDPKAAECNLRGDFRMLSANGKPPGSPLDMSFHERQAYCFNQMWRSVISKDKIQAMKELNEAKEKADLSASTLAGFRQLLMHRYGTVYRAWRLALDRSGDGKLSFVEFTSACRAIGFSGNIKKLWNELDDDGSGVISLAEVDPPVHALIESFWELMNEKFEGNMVKAWRTWFDLDKNNRLDPDEWVEKLSGLGYPKGDAKRLFKQFQKEYGKPYLSLDDISEKAQAAIARGDEDMTTDQQVDRKTLMQMDFITRQSMHGKQQWVEKLAAKQKKSVVDYQKDKMKKNKGAQTLSQFKHLLIMRFGSMLVAWRKALDTSGDGKLSFQEFTKACRALGYAGNIAALWKELDDDDSGVITLRELDEQAFKQLEAFYECIENSYGDIYTAWIKCIEPECTGQVEVTTFEKRIVKLGYTATAPSALVKALCPQDDAAYLFLRDLDKEAHTKVQKRFKKIQDKKRLEALKGKDIGAATKQ
jgi:Ca2+-binding EF-hand superfamily protein